jgi:hypothetical protein
MVTPDLVARAGRVDTIVCHTDFDGLASAAKWLRGGNEPYPGADDDARAIDTRLGIPSAIAQRFDRALRARPKDTALFGIVVRHLAAGLSDASLWEPIDAAGAALAPIEAETRRIAEQYRRLDAKGGGGPGAAPVHSVAFVDATRHHGKYDKTLLLLLGQERADVSTVVDLDTLTLAARFGSGINFLKLLGLSGGMPTLVSVHRDRLGEALVNLGVDGADIRGVIG